MKFAIETENLTKRFGNGVMALQNLSIRIPHGQIVGYVGSNGAGKTTTMKILTTLVRPTAGRAIINGINVQRNPKKALFDVGALLEIPGVYENLTPWEMLTFYGKIYGMSSREVYKRIEEVLYQMKLLEWGHKKMGSFSTGMTRRVNIAKAILHKPRVLILDEPVLGLDPKGIKDVRELIKHLRDGGMTIFLSSHLLGEVSETCDSIIFIENGMLVRSESVQEIERKTELRLILVKFLVPPTQPEIQKIGKIPGISSVESMEEGIRIGYDGRPQSGSMILSELIKLDFKIVSFTPQKATLEDYYVSVMRQDGMPGGVMMPPGGMMGPHQQQMRPPPGRRMKAVRGGGAPGMPPGQYYGPPPGHQMGAPPDQYRGPPPGHNYRPPPGHHMEAPPGQYMGQPPGPMGPPPPQWGPPPGHMKSSVDEGGRPVQKSEPSGSGPQPADRESGASGRTEKSGHKTEEVD